MAHGAADDCELIAGARRGDRQALDALVRRHDRFVRGVVYSTLGSVHQLEDVVQQVWTTVCQQIDSLVDPARWQSWLFRLARNAAIDAGMRQSRQRRTHAPLAAVGEAAQPGRAPTGDLAAREEHERILAAIRGLPAIYREPFVLRHLEEWSYAEIAEALDIPVDTVETRLVRARRLLREALGSLRPDS